MCYFHMIKNIEPYLKVMPNKRTCARIKMDIDALFTCPNEEVFLKAMELFLHKWRVVKDVIVKDFVKYFHSNWLQE